MKKFVVLFCLPAAAIADWMASVDEATRKEQTEKLMQEWNEWLAAHESSVVDKGLPLGKTKRVDANGITDMKNDLNWYLVVQAESQEAAAEMFTDHPHILQIPSAYVQVMGTAGMGM